MAYATEADLDAKWEAEFVTLLACDPATELRDSARIVVALDNASALIDGYLAKRYELPIDASDAGLRLLRNLCCDLAVGELATSPGKRNEIVKEAVDRAMKFLADLGMGRADIPQNPVGSGEEGVGPISPNEAVIVAPERQFIRGSM